MLQVGGEQQYRGHTGYADEPGHKYAYDSLVPNHSNIQVEDFVVLRDHQSITGYGVVSRIEEEEGTKVLSRCPSCERTGLKYRTTMSPAYRCGNCGTETDEPTQDEVDCRKFEAYFEGNYVEASSEAPVEAFQECCVSYNPQLAINRVDCEHLRSLLEESGSDGLDLMAANGNVASVGDPSERQEDFKTAITSRVDDDASVNQCTGISNSARVVSGGVIFGAPNLSGISDECPAIACWSRICVQSDIELYLCIELPGQAVRDRLDQMAQLRAAGDRDHFTASHNHVGILLAENGQAYLFHSNRHPPATGWVEYPLPDYLGDGIEVANLYVSVFREPIENRFTSGVMEFIRSLADQVGEGRVHNLDLWADGRTVQVRTGNPADLDVSELVTSVKNFGQVYKSGLVERIHKGLTYLPHRHFVILSGVSGTGKTSFAHRYACAVHGIQSLDVDNPYFFICRVRPDWTDPSGVLGYIDVITQKYVTPVFLQALMKALANPSIPVYVCLDEMNLARLEYYFADLLSGMETPDVPLTLHNRSVPVESDAGGVIPATVEWPDNLYVIGTINIDETTSTPSPKVLDRAVVVDMSDVDLGGFLDKLAADNDLSAAVAGCRDVLDQLLTLLQKHQLGFGYRVIEEVVVYVARTGSDNGDAANALDEQILQKILPKLRGSSEQAELLEGLKSVLRSLPKSLDLSKKLEQQLLETGSFNALQVIS